MTGSEADKQYLLDLLVDGELADEQRRELLSWCQREPDGWRRCALAFLEAQDWSQVLGGLTKRSADSVAMAVEFQDEVRNDAVSPRSSVSPLARPRSVWHVRQWGTTLAMAASVALAFTLGLWVREAGKAGRIAPGDSPEMRIVEDGTSPVRIRPGRPEQGPADAASATGGQAETAGARQWPAMAGDAPAGEWLLAQPDAVPDEVRRALERLGHRVEQRRQWVPYRLDDGRRVLVPVDQVEVRPVENRSYQ